MIFFEEWWDKTHWSAFNPVRILYACRKTWHAAWHAGYYHGCKAGVKKAKNQAFRNECLNTFDASKFYDI